MDIPQGYKITFHTWENDADAWKELSLTALSFNDVCFFLEFSKYFKSCSGDEKLLGNRGVEIKEIYDVIHKCLEKFPPDTEIQKELDDLLASDDEYHCYEWLIENILGYPENEVYCYNYENFCRVIDHCEVHYFPVIIKDVTETDFPEFECSQPNFYTVQEPLAPEL